MPFNLYNSNGLIFWTEEEIRIREMVVSHMKAAIESCLVSMNSAFRFIRVEAPLLTPKMLINSSYNDDDYYGVNYNTNDDQFYNEPHHLSLRPETTMGSYAYAKHILSGYHDPKYRLPLVVWQHGKSFRQEQDQPTKFMRLKEFYQLEFQILFGEKTANDYYPDIVEAVKKALNELLYLPRMFGLHHCFTIPSDRLPSYSEETTDIMFGSSESKEGMEICSISRRKDFNGAKNIEVAIGTCRVVHNFLKKRNQEELG